MVGGNAGAQHLGRDGTPSGHYWFEMWPGTSPVGAQPRCPHSRLLSGPGPAPPAGDPSQFLSEPPNPGPGLLPPAPVLSSAADAG